MRTDSKNFFNLLEKNNNYIYVNSKNEISYHYRWNLIGRLFAWIRDPYSTKLNKAIKKTIENSFEILKNNFNQQNTFTLNGKKFTKIKIIKRLKKNLPDHLSSIRQLEERLKDINKPAPIIKETTENHTENEIDLTLQIKPSTAETSTENPLGAVTTQIASAVHQLTIQENIFTQVDPWIEYLNQLRKAPIQGEYHPEQAILEFLLNDYVGGGQGNKLSRTVLFYQHYLAKYCHSFPQDQVASRILAELNLFYDFPHSHSLEEVEDTLLAIVKKDRYVAFSGGYFQSEGGHALFYELFLESEDQVGIKVTNTGDGLHFHPLHHSDLSAKRDYYYRTLIFPCTTLQKLKESQYLQMLVGFTRSRAKSNQVELSEAAPSIGHLYRLLVYAWPVQGEIKATNPGGAQRGNSCSVKALVKSIRERYHNDYFTYLHFTFWIKIQALKDALDHENSLSPAFLKDAVRKISAQASKMQQDGHFSEEIFAVWSEVEALVRQRLQVEITNEKKLIQNLHISFAEGIDFSQVEPIQLKIQKSKNIKISSKGYSYSHCLLGELPDFSKTFELAESYIDNLSNETVYRLNFLRVMPDFDQFDFEYHVASALETMEGVREKFFNSLSLIIQKFFYNEEGAKTLHLDDRFMVDLLNGWMIVYQEAKKDQKISHAVFLEWMEGLELFIDRYTPEYQLDALNTKKRFQLIRTTCAAEKEWLFQQVKEKSNRLWQLYDPKIDLYKWEPFGSKLLNEEGKIGRQSELPAMAKFAYEVALQEPKNRYYQFATSKCDWTTVAKYTKAFGLPLPKIPYYNQLRKALAYFFVLGERHFFKSERFFTSNRPAEAMFVSPDIEEYAYVRGICIQTNFYVSTNHPKAESTTLKKFFPEHFFPQGRRHYQEQTDLNQRISKISSDQVVQYPFFTPSEEKEFLTFVQLDSYTKITEGLKFFEQKIFNLADPIYQAAFEALLWGGEESLFELWTVNPKLAHANVELLFTFLGHCYEKLLSRETAQISLAFLLQMELKLSAVAETLAIERQQSHFEELFNRWEHLIRLGKTNPQLALALSRAVFIALPSVEPAFNLRNHPTMIYLTAATLLLECSQTLKNAKHHTLDYAYALFKKILAAQDTSFIWHAVSKLVLDTCHPQVKWEEDELSINHLRFNLKERECLRIEENYLDEEKGLLPSKISRSYHYKSFFAKKNIFAKSSREGKTEVYHFSLRESSYKIIYVEGKIEVFKNAEGENLKLLVKDYPSSLERFAETHHIWKKEDIFYLEDIKNGSYTVLASPEEIKRLKEGIPTGEILGRLDPDSLLFKWLNQVVSPEDIFVWMKKGMINEIELPHLQLTLIPEVQKSITTFAVKEYPGFYVAKEQRLECLPGFQNVLIIENNQGQRRIWIPLGSVIEKKYLPYALEPIHLSLNQKNKKITFDMRSGEVFPMHANTPLTTTLLLITLSLHTKQYEQALTLIKDSGLLQSRACLNDEQEELLNVALERRMSTGSLNLNRHPHLIATRMHLYTWLALQEKTRRSFFSCCYQRDAFKDDFALYLDIKNHIGIYKLSLKKEKTLAQLYSTKVKSQATAPQTFDLNMYINSFDWLWANREEILAHVEAPVAFTSFNAPGEEFIFNFLHFYKTAKEKKQPELSALKRILAIVATDRSSQIACCALILAYAIEITKSPSYEEMEECFKLDLPIFEQKLKSIIVEAKKTLEMSFNTSEWYLGKSHHISIRQSSMANKKNSLNLPELQTHKKPLFISIQIKPEHSLNIIHDEKLICAHATDFTSQRQAANTISEWATTHANRAKTEEENLLAAEFLRIKKGTVLYGNELDRINQEFNLAQDIPEIEKVLIEYERILTEDQAQRVELKKQILTLAHDTHRKNDLALEFLREGRLKLELETLMIAVGRKDYEAIHQGNPSLLDKEIERIVSLVGNYALLTTKIQKYTRCFESLKNYHTLLSMNQIEKLDVVAQQYITQRDAQRVYQPQEHSQILIFEALGDVLLREEQFKALELLNNENWTLFEAPTGFGKTSILERLWLLLNANKKSLAIMVAPTALFDQQEEFLQNFFYQAFQIFGLRIDFQRHSPSSAEDFKHLLHQLKKAHKHGKPVFMSDQTAHNLFVLKPKELMNHGKDSTALKDLLELLTYVKREGLLFVDEPHKVLADHEESNYSIGLKKPLKKERLVLSLQIYAAFIKVIEGRYRIECWTSDKDAILPLLNNEHIKNLRQPIIEAILKETGLQKIDQETMDYLVGEMDYPTQIDFENKLKTAENLSWATKIRVIHDQLHHYLPQTLNMNANEHYGTGDPEGNRVAIPLEEARHPKEGNEYCSVDQILNFTIQLNLKIPFSIKYIDHFFDNLINEASKEIEKKDVPLHETIAYRKFTLLSKLMGNEAPKNLLGIKHVEKERFQSLLENNFALRLQFIGLAVLPHVSRYEEKVVSTPHLLANSFKRVVGASGTLSLQNLPARLDILQDELAIARTLITMQKKDTSLPIVECKTQGSYHILASLLEAARQSGLSNPSVFIECGAVLRDYTSPTLIAIEILRFFPQFKGTAFFDKNGTPMVVDKDSKRELPLHLSSLKKDELFWIFAQKDTTGRDIQLDPQAQAIVFINEHTDLTSLVQAIGRMRGIHLGQQARILIDTNATSIVKQFLGKPDSSPLFYLDILEYCVKKSAIHKGETNFLSLDLKGQGILENCFWDYFLRDQCKENCVEYFGKLRTLFVEDTSDNPLMQPSFNQHRVPIHQGLISLKEKFNKKMAQIQAILDHSPLKDLYNNEKMMQGWKTAQQQMLYLKNVKLNDDKNQRAIAMAETVSTKETAQQVLVEMQGEQESENQVETLSTQFASSLANLSSKQPLKYKLDPIFYLPKDIFTHSKLKEFADLFSPDLAISENIFLTFEGDSLENPGWLNGYVKHLHYVHLDFDQNKLHFFKVCDQVEASALAKSGKGTVWLINQGVMISFEGKTTPDILTHSQCSELEVQVKILEGDLTMSPAQWSTFKKWATSDKSPLLLKFLKEIIIPLKPYLRETIAYKTLLNYLMQNTEKLEI